jgi:hypothetical protein
VFLTEWWYTLAKGVPTFDNKGMTKINREKARIKLLLKFTFQM